MSLALLPRWRQVAGKAFDFLLPPLCLGCDAAVSANHTLCPSCWSGIHFIAPPICAGCGAPFATPVGDGLLCGDCIAYPTHFTTARAPMLYDDASKPIVLNFKHGDRIHPAKALAAWMHRAGQEFWPRCDILMPVPLHRWRLYKRRYNQAALLAQALGVQAQKPVLVDTLRRIRPTPIQGHLNRKDRQENVKNAFALNPRYADAIKGKMIVLIDDVMTTGATVNECSRILKAAGAQEVHVLTLARVRNQG